MSMPELKIKLHAAPRNLKRKDRIPERKFSFETPPAPIPAADIKETISSDVVVVGGGISGVAAALSAAESGAKVILIEKTKTINGFGGGAAAIGSRIQNKLGINIDRDEVILNLMKYAGNKPNQRLLRMWAYDSHDTMDWVLEMTDAVGIKITIDQFPPPALFNNANEYYPSYLTCHLIESPGMKLVSKCLADVAQKKGVSIYTSTRAKQLVKNEKNKVTGVIAQNGKGEYIRFNSNKAVVLCTGDYGNNPEMVVKYCPAVEDMVSTLVTATGDGHQMAMWIGAVMEPGPHPTMTHGMAGPVGCGAFLQVNRKGERFHNEDVPGECYCIAIKNQPGQMSWQIFDSKYQDQFPYMGIGLGKHVKPGDMINEFVMQQAIKADSIEELARKMEVPVDTFKATIERYNELAHKGKDLDFSKRADRMFALETPPYYAGKGNYWFICVLGGLNVNTKLQPLDKDWEVIPGLYLGGNIAGNRYGVEYPTMCPGLSNGMALHFGRVAGLNAAKEQTD